MSGTNTPRPWHGSTDPFGALHDWAMKELGALREEIAKLKGGQGNPAQGAVTPPAAPIVHPSPSPSPTPPDSNPSAPA